MIAARLARELVVSTNRWPILEHVYRAAYDGALRVAVRQLQTVPGVIAILLRQTGPVRRWAAGLSDFDLTIICDDHASPAGAVEFLDRFWRTYRRTKRIVPQLGETEIMTCGEYDDFLRFGPMPTASLKRSIPLFVRRNEETMIRSVLANRRLATDREVMLDALSRYVRFLLPAYVHWIHHPRSIFKRRVEHLLTNVEARLAWPQPAAPSARSLEERLWGVFNALVDRCRSMSFDGLTAARARANRNISIDSASREWAHGIATAARLPDLAVIRWASYMAVSPSTATIVPDTTSSDELNRLTRALAASTKTFHAINAVTSLQGDVLERYFSRPIVPAVFSKSMWRSWCNLSALDGISAANGMMLIGTGDDAAFVPTVASIHRDRQVQYTVMLPLKNNWRPAGKGRPELYSAIAEMANGYQEMKPASEMTVRPRHVGSLVDGYAAATDALLALRSTL